MNNPPISVQVDGRVRLLGAVLSLTTWPFQEQDEKKHDVHAHARATRQHLQEFENHQAVQSMQELLESRRSLDDIFSFSTCLNWPNLRARSADIPEWSPADWPAQLRDFAHASKLKEFWERNSGVWEEAERQCKQALMRGEPVKFLSQFFGDLDIGLVFQPNLIFPSDRAVGFRWESELFCICPPRIAWGHNPPWPFDDDPAFTMADAMLSYSRTLLREFLEKHPEEREAASKGKLPVPNTFRARFPDWFDQFAVLFTNGVTSIYLEQTFSKAEAASFTVMAQKAYGFDVMPSVIEVLGRYLDGYREGKFKDFSDYMSTFSKVLSVAQSMRSM